MSKYIIILLFIITANLNSRIIERTILTGKNQEIILFGDFHYINSSDQIANLKKQFQNLASSSNDLIKIYHEGFTIKNYDVCSFGSELLFL